MIDDLSLYVMSILYLAAGINHFINPKWYTRIIPSWLPRPDVLNIISGTCEIVFAILLIPLATRTLAAWLIIILLITIFPANIQMSIQYHQRHHRYFWLTVVRLPLQLVLIWWAWYYTQSR
jgi:uncharacterized membrane protein